jgi:hypothetical protein
LLGNTQNPKPTVVEKSSLKRFSLMMMLRFDLAAKLGQNVLLDEKNMKEEKTLLLKKSKPFR